MIYLGAWNCGLPALMNSKQLICWAHYLFCFTPQYIEGKCESFALALSRSLSFVFNISILWMKFPFIKHFEFKVFCVASLFSIFDFWFLLYSWYNGVLSSSKRWLFADYFAFVILSAMSSALQNAISIQETADFYVFSTDKRL